MPSSVHVRHCLARPHPPTSSGSAFPINNGCVSQIGITASERSLSPPCEGGVRGGEQGITDTLDRSGGPCPSAGAAAEPSRTRTAYQASVPPGPPPLTPPSQGGETRNETGMNSRPLQDELFITPGQGGLIGIASTLGRCDNSAEDSRRRAAHQAVVTRGYPPCPPSQGGDDAQRNPDEDKACTRPTFQQPSPEVASHQCSPPGKTLR